MTLDSRQRALAWLAMAARLANDLLAMCLTSQRALLDVDADTPASAPRSFCGVERAHFSTG